VTPRDLETAEHTVRAHEAGRRLDKLISDVGLVPSRSFGQRLIERDLVSVNGSIATKRHIVKAGEWIEVTLPPPIESSLEPEEIPLDVRFEDEHIIVLSKPAAMVVHPTDTHTSGTLVHALLAHADELGSLGGVERPGIVHRLDKDTSGLMLVAKNDEAQAILSDAIRIRAVDRRYATLVHGRIVPDTGLIDAPIGRDPKRRMRMTVSHEDGARQAVTNFTVLARYESDYYQDDGFTLLECKLHTGRTHQIRVHMAYIDHRIVGDPWYGYRDRSRDLGLERQFLHSYRLELDHPISGEHLAFEDALPDDLASTLGELADRSCDVTEEGLAVGRILVSDSEGLRRT
jgi:23S rRNA pseudouridine1911/1915/1917 synthase